MTVVRKPGKDKAAFLNAVADLDTKKVAKVGWFPSAKYANGTQVAYVATIQEYGYPEGNIPARSFIRSTISEKKVEWTNLLKSGVKAILAGNATVNDVLEAVGGKAAGDIRKTITDIQEPPLKESTIAARLRLRADTKTVGSLTKPLVDSGILLNTLTNTVENK